MAPAQRQPLPGGRWHFQHGPIDIVISAEGEAAALQAAHAAAWARFQPLLGELVAELPRLRQPVDPMRDNPLHGEVARRMWAACAPLHAAAQRFITPMAAVAGAVAQTLIAAYQRPGIHRAWVNNGGDIALHLAEGASARVGLVADLSRFDAEALARTAEGTLRTDAAFTLHHADPVRGVATSGWRGRSLSRGIADSVTVLAADAARADAAATVIANTVDVPALPAERVQEALRQGLAVARALQQAGRVHAVLLVCQGSLARLPPVAALESVQLV